MSAVPDKQPNLSRIPDSDHNPGHNQDTPEEQQRQATFDLPPNLKSYLDECDIDDEQLKDCLRTGWKPNDRQLVYAKLYIMSQGGLTKSAMSKRTGFPLGTIRGWHEGRAFNGWLQVCLEHFAGTAGLSAAWATIAKSATNGDRHCAHMLFMRYDKAYRAAINKEAVRELDTENEPDSGDLARAGKILRAKLGSDSKQESSPGEERSDPASVAAKLRGRGGG